MQCDLDTSVPDWLIDHPESAAVFAELQIDTSCGGKSLEYVCQQRGINAELKGTWALSTNFKPYIGKGYVHDERRADGLSIATFRFKAPKSGRYQIDMAYSAHETRATNVPMVVTSGRYIAKLTVDQTQPLLSGQHFRNVGSVELTDDVETVVTVSNQNTNGFVRLDALQLTEAVSQSDELQSGL